MRNVEKPIFTIEEVASLLSISSSTVNELVDKRMITFASLPFGIRFSSLDIDSFLKNSGSKGISPLVSTGPKSEKKKKFCIGAAAFTSILLISMVASAEFTAFTNRPLNTFEEFRGVSDPPISSVPLNSPIVFKRSNSSTISTGSGATQQVMSLIFNNSADRAFPWALFTQLTTSHNSGDAVGHYVSLGKTGSGWASAYHADVFHETTANGFTLGANYEVHKATDSGAAIGINIQSEPGKTVDSALNIQSNVAAWNSGVKFDGSRTEYGINFTPTSNGQIAILVGGTFGVALDTGKNHIRMNAGSKLMLEESSQVCMVYNSTRGRIEFRVGDRVLGFIPLSTVEHEL